jgi:hypothetical protein
MERKETAIEQSIASVLTAKPLTEAKSVESFSWEELNAFEVDMNHMIVIVITSATKNQFQYVLDQYVATQEENIEDILRAKGFAATTATLEGKFKI